ncbi:ATP-binding cassette domain-containing protein [Amycolatopsis sp. CA-230715]|uniref:ATP-binding cassette domain-containing protein n=1 Tax=Amycolatopsis sp. CA-230715 TaxID=2745196 RepID=UPI001C018E2A|nr:ATP-binding cassette domain-containing protein [Amycolatopsis sp. CA-230715]QWF85103.1 Daunorubicin/doxorubicin resistance ATP-binding protein DrrA [Amycolatopsis sp. CA-230715]
MTAAIETEGLRKSYGKNEALRGVDLRVPAGTVLGVLGRNGAGKTTTVRILSTLLTPNAGRATVAGFDVVREQAQVRRRIGLAGQYAAVDGDLTGRENLVLLGKLLHLGRRIAKARAAELLTQFDLTGAADRPARTYSGGMRRRLDLASCLIARPPVIFLDEPTTGLDPSSRSSLWAAIRAEAAAGATVLLTTQYLEEADKLADRIVVIDGGKVVAEGSPDELKRTVGGEWLEIVVADPRNAAQAREILIAEGGDAVSAETEGSRVRAPVPGGVGGIGRVAARLDTAGIAVLDFALRRPSLDDVFFAITASGGAETVAPKEKEFVA